MKEPDALETGSIGRGRTRERHQPTGHTRSARKGGLRAPGSSRRGSFVERVVLAIVLLVPVVFSRWTADAWDFPKGALLVAGGLVLAGYGLAAELDRIAQSGAGAWADAVPRRLAAALRRNPLGAAMLVFLVSSIASAVASANVGIGLFGAHGSYAGALVAAAATAVLWASSGFTQRRPWFRSIAVATAVAATFASLYAVVQFSGRDPVEWGMVPYLRGLRRAAGTMGQPNLLGAFLAMALPSIVWLVLRSSSWAARIGWGAVALLSGFGLVTTFSRASWLALAAAAFVGLVAYVWTVPADLVFRSRRRIALGVTAALAVLAFAGLFVGRSAIGPRLISRVRDIASMRESGNASRLEAWRLAIRMGATRPILGVGTDQFGLEFPAYRTPAYYRLEYGAVPATAHNVVVNLFANQGLLGLAAGALVVIFGAGALLTALRRTRSEEHLAAVAVTTSLTVFLIWDLVNYTVPALAAIAAVLAGWAAGIAARGAPAPTTHGNHGPSGWSVAIAGTITLMAAIPLVVRPVLAQHAQRVAMALPAGSMAQVEAQSRAAAYAPWDGRHEHHVADAYMEVASAQSDTSRKIVFLRRALAAEDRAIRTDRRVALFYARRGLILARVAALGAPNASMEAVRNAFATALERDPANRNIMEVMVEAWLALGRNEEARDLALRIARTYPEAGKPLSYVGLIALRGARWADAADTLKLACERDWGGGELKLKAAALANLSVAYLQTGRAREAKAAAEAALQTDPELKAAAQNREAAVQRIAADSLARGLGMGARSSP